MLGGIDARIITGGSMREPDTHADDKRRKTPNGPERVDPACDRGGLADVDGRGLAEVRADIAAMQRSAAARFWAFEDSLDDEE